MGQLTYDAFERVAEEVLGPQRGARLLGGVKSALLAIGLVLASAYCLVRFFAVLSGR
jgi:hypothetical protein